MSHARTAPRALGGPRVFRKAAGSCAGADCNRDAPVWSSYMEIAVRTKGRRVDHTACTGMRPVACVTTDQRAATRSAIPEAGGLASEASPTSLYPLAAALPEPRLVSHRPWTAFPLNLCLQRCSAARFRTMRSNNAFLKLRSSAPTPKAASDSREPHAQTAPPSSVEARSNCSADILSAARTLLCLLSFRTKGGICSVAAIARTAEPRTSPGQTNSKTLPDQILTVTDVDHFASHDFPSAPRLANAPPGATLATERHLSYSGISSSFLRPVLTPGDTCPLSTDTVCTERSAPVHKHAHAVLCTVRSQRRGLAGIALRTRTTCDAIIAATCAIAPHPRIRQA